MALKISAESLPAVVVFVVSEGGTYRCDRRWGSFDSFNLRAIDDLYFEGEGVEHAVYGFTAEPPFGARSRAVSLPLQMALERIYFHIAEPDRLVLNPRGVLHGAATPVRMAEFSVPADFDAEVVILRDDIPDLLGELATGSVAGRDRLARAEKALSQGLFFECFHLARAAREEDPKNPMSWFMELFAFSFFGKPDDALALYEEYPERGASHPHALLLAARYRLLLNQLNEARTILHTVSFDKELGATASCELARSFLIDKQFAKAIDAATAAITKDEKLSESYLVRGVAQRAISYEAGERESLLEAYADFERVAKQGGHNAAEALYHAGTISARLGALEQAEELFRRSLFQRARLSPRDALIRVLCARERIRDAEEELSVLEQLAPQYGATLREQVTPALQKAPSSSPPDPITSSSDKPDLWVGDHAARVSVARQLIADWAIPVDTTLSDCALLDDFINRFASDGDFPREGEFSELYHAGTATVARAFALHIGQLLVVRNVCHWGPEGDHGLTLVSIREDLRIPIEHFVKERILLGASGDNFSSLESLIVELHRDSVEVRGAGVRAWWVEADAEGIGRYEGEAEWARGVLEEMGAPLAGNLSDFAVLDEVIDSAFEPGGTLLETARAAIGGELDRFISGVGLYVGNLISRNIPSVWYVHDRAEGVSLVAGDLGRIFPVARLQRRIYLASAADFATKLSSMAWSVAVASITEEVRSGSVVGHAAIKAKLLERLPSIGEFPERELDGVVDSLVIAADLKVKR